jgi:hypothetical protein
MLDSLNTQLTALTALFLLTDQDRITFGLTPICSSAIYHGQLLVYRREHRMIQPPTNGVEAQTLVAISFFLYCGLVLYAGGEDQSFIVQSRFVFSVVANMIQLNNCLFYAKFLHSKGVLKPHIIFLATFIGFLVLFWGNLISLVEYTIISAILPLMVTGLLVLYAVTEKHDSAACKQHVDYLDTPDRFLIGWLVTIAICRIIPCHISSIFDKRRLTDSITWVALFSWILKLLNHLSFCIPILCRIDKKKKL